MGSIFRQLAWLILAMTFMVFVTFFGRIPALRKTPVGTLYRLIWHHLPHALSTIDQKLTSGRLSRSSSWLYNRIMYERHPTIVIFFLAIMIVSESMFIPPAWPQISSPSKLAVSVVVFMPYFFLYLSCSADPGYITPGNHARHMSLYPFDHANFHPGSECRTCRLPKPARSKHCDVCKRCVARADHHCVFINSCVGYGNHGWFLLLLASTSLLTTYGGLLGLSLLAARMRGINPGWSLWPPAGMDRNAYLVVWAWGLQGNVPLAATTLLALLTTPLVCGLLGYSLFLVYCGTTTNESMKWAGYKEDIADGFAYRRPLAAARPRDPWYEPRCGRWPAEAEHIMLATHDGRPPAPDADLGGSGVWERVRSLKDVDNLYDRGFWHNLCDIFQEDYAFGNPGIDEPPSERRWQRKMAKTG